MKYYLFFFLLSMHALKTPAQDASSACRLDYSLCHLKDSNASFFKVLEFRIYLSDIPDSTIYQWANGIGLIKIKKKHKDLYEIFCYCIVASLHHKEIHYHNELIYKIYLNRHDCSIIKEKIFNKRVDTQNLASLYEPLKNQYFGSLQTSDTIPAELKKKLQIYGYDLFYGALMGSKKCQQLFYLFCHELTYMAYEFPGPALVIREWCPPMLYPE